MKKIIIIGGGMAGLGAAWSLSEKNCRVQVLEADTIIGGLAKTVKINNQNLDIGPHSFFSEDKEVLKKVLDLFEGEKGKIQFSKKRKMKMIFKGKYVDYPLSIKSMFQMGFLSPILSFLSFLKSYIKLFLISFFGKRKINEDPSIEEWAIDNFGKYLYVHFFKPYSEQFWKINTKELSYKVIPTRSKKINFASTLKHLLINKYLDLAKREPGDLSLQERESLPTYYPKDGFGEIANRIAKKIEEKNGEIYLSQNVEQVIIKSNQKFEIKTKDRNFDADIVISTIPIDKIINKINPPPKVEILENGNKLEYLSLILIYISTNKKNVLDCEYCYFVERTFNRVSEMNFISGNETEDKENLLIVEISCHYDDKMWNLSRDEIFSLCIKDFEKDNLLDKNDVLNYEMIKMQSVYPIYRKNYKNSLLKIQNYFSETKNLHSIGRQGQFYYGDSDQMIRMGFDVAKKIDEDLKNE
jgi:protoporphyrinogen oxidase